jgi:hypothetical protein
MPPLEPREHRISAKEAAEHTRRHRAQHGRIGEGDHGGAFHADQVLAILAQKGCTALRIYYGRNEKNLRSIVLVGMDKDGKDMESGLLCELSWPCPPFCEDSTLTRD